MQWSTERSINILALLCFERSMLFDNMSPTPCAAPLQVKAASDFHKSKRRRLGLHIYCKTCCAAASASRAKTKQPVTQPTVDAKARMLCAAQAPVGDTRDLTRYAGLPTASSCCL